MVLMYILERVSSQPGATVTLLLTVLVLPFAVTTSSSLQKLVFPSASLIIVSLCARAEAVLFLKESAIDLMTSSGWQASQRSSKAWLKPVTLPSVQHRYNFSGCALKYSLKSLTPWFRNSSKYFLVAEWFSSVTAMGPFWNNVRNLFLFCPSFSCVCTFCVISSTDNTLLPASSPKLLWIMRMVMTAYLMLPCLSIILVVCSSGEWGGATGSAVKKFSNFTSSSG